MPKFPSDVKISNRVINRYSILKDRTLKDEQPTPEISKLEEEIRALEGDYIEGDGINKRFETKDFVIEIVYKTTSDIRRKEIKYN